MTRPVEKQAEPCKPFAHRWNWHYCVVCGWDKNEVAEHEKPVIKITATMIKAAWVTMVPSFVQSMHGMIVKERSPGVREALKAALEAGGYKVEFE